MATETVEEAKVPLGLLDQPILMEGKRKRKATKQFNIETVVPKKKVATKHVGSGIKLQDIPSVDYTLTEKFKADDLRMLYKVCFEVTGKATTLKKELKQFQGFAFDKGSEEYKKKKIQLNKLNKSCLTAQFCAPLCLKEKGTKEEIVDRIMEFLLCPTDSGETAVTSLKKARQKQKKKDKSTDIVHQETAAATSGSEVETAEETKSSDQPSADATKDENEDKEKE